MNTIIVKRILTVLLFSFISLSSSYSQIDFPNTNEGNNSALVDQYVPERMEAGNTYKVYVTMRNTGKTTWNSGILDNIFGGYALKSVSSDMNLWSENSVNVSSTVNPGENYTFNFTVTAPKANGVYNFQWRMAEGSSFFGDYTKNVRVNVVNGNYSGNNEWNSNIYNNAVFVGHTIPAEMKTHKSYRVTVTMRNSGNNTWQKGNYRLEAVSSNTGASDINSKQIKLKHSVSQGESAQFSFNIKAPSSAGNYFYQWRMLDNNSGFFGEATPVININVYENSSKYKNDERYYDRKYDDDDKYEKNGKSKNKNKDLKEKNKKKKNKRN